MSTREEGLDLLRRGDAEGAVLPLQRAVREDPEDGRAWMALGIALCQSCRTGEGVQALHRAAALLPAVPAIYYNLGRGLEDLGRREEALRAYHQALELDASHAHAAAAAARLSAPPPAGAAAASVSLRPPEPTPRQASPVGAVSSPEGTATVADYSPAMPMMGPAPNYSRASYAPPAMPPRSRSSGTGWIIAICALGAAVFLVAVIGIMAAILMPVMVQARRAAMQAERRRTGAMSSPAPFPSVPRTPAPSYPGPSFGPSPGGPVLNGPLGASPIPEPRVLRIPQPRIVVPRPPEVVIPEPPRIAVPPPPVVEPPSLRRTSPFPNPDSSAPPFGPRTFPTPPEVPRPPSFGPREFPTGPRFGPRYGPRFGPRFGPGAPSSPGAPEPQTPGPEPGAGVPGET